MILRRNIVGQLVPDTANDRRSGEFRYTLAIQKIAAVGEMLRLAIHDLGILHELHDDTVILADHSAAEFPGKDIDPRQNAILMKGDRVTVVRTQLSE